MKPYGRRSQSRAKAEGCAQLRTTLAPGLLINNDLTMLEAVPSPAMEIAVDCYLAASFERKLVVQLVWPGGPHNALLIQTLSALRLRGGTEVHGLRGLFYPSKATSHCSLTQYHVETGALLRCVQNVAQTGDTSAATIVLLRLQELIRGMEEGKERSSMRHPHLNDIVLHFRPTSESKEIWPNVCDHLFQGLRKDMKLSHQCKTSFPDFGEAALARDAVFHIPHASNLTEIKRLISSQPLMENPPAIMLIDATRQTVAACSFNLRTFFPKVMKAVCDAYRESPPGFYLLTDDPVMAKALRYDLSKEVPEWKSAGLVQGDFEVQGATIDWPHGDNGFARPRPTLPVDGVQSRKVKVEGLSSGKVHYRISRLSNILRENSLDEAFRQTQRTNRFLRRITTLPCGMAELRKWLLEAGLSDEAMDSYSRNFIWKTHELSLQRMISDTSAAVVTPHVRRLIKEIDKLYCGFENGTPMAFALLEEVRWVLSNAHGRVVIVFPRWFQAMLAERFLLSQGIGQDQDAERIGYQYGKVPEAILDDESVDALIVACNPEDHLDLLLSRDFRGRLGTFLLFDIEGAKRASRLLDIILQDSQLRGYHRRAGTIKTALDKQIPRHLLTSPLMPDLGSAFKLSDGWREEADTDPVLKTADHIILYFVDRGPLLCGRDSMFRVYDRESWNAPKFIIKNAKDLSEGDQVFLMPDDLRSEIEALLRTGGKQSVQHLFLENYHQEISRLTASISRKKTVVARAIFEAMCRLDPEMEKRENVTNVLRWISIEGLREVPIEERRPQAPRRRRHFLAFAKAIGIEQNMAETYWNLSICQIRKDRINEGRGAGEFFTNLLFDATYVAILTQIPRSRVDELRMKALDNLHQIQRVQL